jgi:transcriptional regulator with XRE-family HTH domain
MAKVTEFGLDLMIQCKRLGITQGQVASDIGITRTYLNLIMNGNRVPKKPIQIALDRKLEELKRMPSPDLSISGGKEKE